MPYQPDYVQLQHSTGRSFRVLEDLTFRDPHGHPFTARAGLVTDLATIPHSLWSVIAPFGQQSLPAIVHDQECKDAKARSPQRCRQRRAERRVTDARFHQALLARGVPRFRAAMMWAGVSIGRYWDHGSHLLRIWLFVQLTLGWVAIMWGGFHTGDWTGWVALGAPVGALRTGPPARPVSGAHPCGDRSRELLSLAARMVPQCRPRGSALPTIARATRS